MPTDFLKDIIARKKERIAQAKARVSLDTIKGAIGTLPVPLSLSNAISRPRQLSLIAEIKKASPSRGLIRSDFDIRRIAQTYKEAGVQAVSVITEEDFFQGNPAFIAQAKAVIDVPVLRKDFIIDPYQVYESRLFLADALLLIAAALTMDQLEELLALASSLGMECLVEVHTEKELKKVLKAKPLLLGINNRDLHTLAVDLKTTEKLFPLVPKDKTVVVESGLAARADVLFLKVLGVSAVLIGHAFLESADIRRKIDEVMGW
jgi:indole-3-glycerol phosphate synthase